MTPTGDYTLPTEVLELLVERGLDAVPELIRVDLNVAMQAEREQYLGAAPYERTEARRGYANGYKDKTVTTRVGRITFDVPQTRDGGFYPQALERGLRGERALTAALAEMYVQGVSTRKVAAITERLCGVELSSMQVSRATAQLDEELDCWRKRPLGICPYLILDARYEKVREGGQVLDAAVLIAKGVRDDGTRAILGVSVDMGEHEVHWRRFLQSLVARGLSGVALVISDDHAGLKAARQAVFGGVPWQRCQFHLQQNAQAYVPRLELKTEVARDIRAIFNADSRVEADERLERAVEKYAKPAPRLAAWLETDLPEGLTGFAFPEAHRRRIRTTNGLERFNREIRRRTRVVGILPNTRSCLRLVTAIAAEISDEWETGRICLTFTTQSTNRMARPSGYASIESTAAELLRQTTAKRRLRTTRGPSSWRRNTRDSGLIEDSPSSVGSATGKRSPTTVGVLICNQTMRSRGITVACASTNSETTIAPSPT